ncbi:Diacylglycerol kinase [Trypanosoma melophagium]|uniref:Diacylglycerol kinase n=1 Tax=Trypanosoma melophagium TaxID=715481 RepID=UPI00351AB100|nr:Diacylglycerol kinase [Trypanosoma melophagium]
MSRFKNCITIINTRSGAREGSSVFASALQQYLDKAGIIHHDNCVPEKNIVHALNLHKNTTDAIIVCGGDGTMSSVMNVLAATPSHPLLTVPIVPVPCGLQNSIATSLGVYSAERSVSAFVMGRVERIPLWKVSVNDKVVRYIASYIAVGAYAKCVQRLHDLDAVGDNYVALPMVRGKYKLGSFYTAMRNELVSCDVKIKRMKDSSLEIQSPIKLLIASQMPLQHRYYTLTPTATFKHSALSVTYATAEASRLRLWHLLSREAAEGVIINEDGVSECSGVSELEFTIAETSNNSENSLDVLMQLDGEPVHLSPGSKVLVQQAPCHVLFTTC